MKEIKNKPTTEETKAAIEIQAPIQRVQSEDKPEIKRSNTFEQLAKVSTNARIAFGGNALWVKPGELFNEKYRDGYESIPFYISRAWTFESKGGYGTRMGIELVMSDGKLVSVALPFKEGDVKRSELVARFKDRGAPPIGPLCMKRLPLNKGDDYYDIVPYENVINSTENVALPFVEINTDVPF